MAPENHTSLPPLDLTDFPTDQMKTGFEALSAVLPKGLKEEFQAMSGTTNFERDMCRFLVARQYNIDASLKMLKEHMSWLKMQCQKNKSNGGNSVSKEGFEHIIEQGCVNIVGRDKSRHPTSYVQVSKLIPSKVKSDVMERFCWLFLATLINDSEADENINPSGENGGGGFVGQNGHGPVGGGGGGSGGYTSAIYDFRGIGLSNLDISVSSAMFKIMQGHCPERMACLYCYDVPIVFWAFFKLLTPFVDPKVRQKLVFLYGDKGKQFLMEEYGADGLPDQLGGTIKTGQLKLSDIHDK